MIDQSDNVVKLNSINIDQLPQNAIDIENRVAEISFNSSLISEMKMINFRNELIRSGINLEKFKQNKEVICLSRHWQVNLFDILEYVRTTANCFLMR